MFKTYTSNLDIELKDGMKVLVLGTVSVFERDGIDQVYAKAIKKYGGMGDLHIAFEKLKTKLEKEGLFDEKHKRKVPFAPKCIGVLTSNTGSVIRDIINVATRRNPNVYIKLLPVPVQGEGASKKIVYGIERMNKEKIADVIILARGGGSLEDLWPFNEEIVARAIYDSQIPIISAIGHETDFTISDFVADLRAPTPSAAAELAVPDVKELKLKLEIYEKRLKQNLLKKAQLMRLRYEKCLSSRVLKEPLQKINEKYMIIDSEIKVIQNKIETKIKNSKLEYIKLISKLDALSPLKTLIRGYSIISLNGKVISKVDELKKNDEINIRMQDGNIKAKIM